MKPDYYGLHTPEQAMQILESSLDAILQALFSARKAREEERDRLQSGPPELQFISIAELIQRAEKATQADDVLDALKREPVEAAFRQMIRMIGEQINEIGGVDLMQSILDRVADIPLQAYGHTSKGSHYGYKSSAVSSAWDGIGSWLS